MNKTFFIAFNKIIELQLRNYKKTITSGQTNFFEKVGTLLENKKKFSNIFLKFKIQVFFKCYGDIKLNFFELLNCNF